VPRRGGPSRGGHSHADGCVVRFKRRTGRRGRSSGPRGVPGWQLSAGATTGQSLARDPGLPGGRENPCCGAPSRGITAPDVSAPPPLSRSRSRAATACARPWSGRNGRPSRKMVRPRGGELPPGRLRRRGPRGRQRAPRGTHREEIRLLAARVSLAGLDYDRAIRTLEGLESSEHEGSAGARSGTPVRSSARRTSSSSS